jgi:hypothetical protein
MFTAFTAGRCDGASRRLHANDRRASPLPATPPTGRTPAGHSDVA